MNIVQWLAGGSSHPYHTLYYCLNGDHPWIIITIVLDLLVATGYILIAYHWWQSASLLSRNNPSRRPLDNIMKIFIYCGICGYIFIPIKMFWPCWRLYDFFMFLLVFFTWRYLWFAKDLKAVYQNLGHKDKLDYEISELKDQSAQKNHFINSISHDLKNPLNGIVLNMAVIDLGISKNKLELVKDGAIAARNCAKIATDILNRFLDFNKLEMIQDVQISEIEIFSLLTSIKDIFGLSAENKGLFLKIDCADDIKLFSDIIKVERILSNLVDNAIKFTKYGTITITVTKKDNGILLNVIDTGIGIKQEEIPLLFNMFTQLNNPERDPKKGYGLGLAIVKKMTDMLKGHITVNSEVGVGSKFSIFLPNLLDQ